MGLSELQRIAASRWTAFPPRLPGQPIFYPVLDEPYAEQIARDWNTADEASSFAGFVTTFDVDDAFAARYPVQVVGGREHRELWVPAEELDALNRHLLGPITVRARFYGPRCTAVIDSVSGLPAGLRGEA